MAKKTDDFDVDDLLAGAASTDTKKKKSNVPVAAVDGDTAKAIKKYIKAQEAKSTIDATIRDLQDDIIPVAREKHADVVDDTNAVPTTIKLQTDDGKAITVDVAKNQYSNTSVDEEPELKKTFGDDYEELFEKQMTISLTKAALKDKEILTKLIKAVGKDNLQKYFSISHVLKPTEKFHNGRFIGSFKDKAKKVVDEGVVKPYKPAIRV